MGKTEVVMGGWRFKKVLGEPRVGIKGCVGYIFVSLFFKSKREHL